MNMAGVQTLVSQFNAADILWVAGALVLAVIAIKVVAKILKVLFFVGAALMIFIFVFSSGILPV